jgi:hypothetical protein
MSIVDRAVQFHCRALNVLARLCGVGFLLGGAAMVGSPLLSAEQLATGTWIGVILAGLGSCAIGVGFLTVRTWRPDLGDTIPTTSRRYEPRSWWTGDPKPPSSASA